MPRTYTVTVQNVIDKVRILTNDTETPYRTEDSEITGWLNDAIKATLTLLPQLFTQTANYTCSAGSRQVLDTNLAHSLIEVIGVPYADYATMSAFNPQWQTDAAGAIQNWLRLGNEPLVFFAYPKQAGGETLTIMYVAIPAALTSTTDNVPLPETYAPALVAYCVSMVESKDDEHVNSNRAQAAMADFVGRITGGKA